MKRFLDLLRAVLLLGLPMLLAAPLSSSGQAATPTVDVLIIYSSGNVPPPGKEDAVTTATPAKENMKTVSEKLEKALSAKKLTVRLASVSGKITPRDILASGIVVMGSPSYWSNVSWQMKKYIDEQFTPFYGMEGKLKKTKAAAYSMAEVEFSAGRTIGVLRDLITQNDGDFGPTMTVLVPQSPEEIQNRITKFADDIAAFIGK
jgi:hypothetical protein